MDNKFTFKFREVLESALQSRLVEFPKEIEVHFQPINKVYRKVTTYSKLSDQDFLSQIENLELRKPFKTEPDRNNIGNYSCSFNSDLDNLRRVMNLPPKNKKIAQGTLYEKFGPILRSPSESHIHCWLYAEADIYAHFKLVEQEE